MKSFLWLICLVIVVCYRCHAYYIGVGIYDITGPASDVNMMGYANINQIAGGIHLRLFSRAFIIQETQHSKPILFVNIDAGMTPQLVKTRVVQQLQKKYGSMFDHQNVLISAIHTHSGPGGYFQYMLYTITSLGFVRQSFDALVDGIVQSVVLAQENVIPGKILISEGELKDSSMSRSPAAYLMNPKEERDLYSSDVDTKMTLLKFVDMKGKPFGMINWFAVHPVSMNESNTLLSSDNKGFASFLFEKSFNANNFVGKGSFVSAFAQSNEGDVTPNLKGPRCIDTGLPCDFLQSTCNGKVKNCIAFGPGANMFESTKIIAQRQLQKATELFNNAKEELTGSVSFVHQFLNMTNVAVNYKGIKGHTCKPAMGYSFAAGTTDGPGDFDFTQGTLNGTLFWDAVRDLIKTPSKELQECHSPKPILLATGEITRPYLWQPEIVETQIFRIGNFLIVAVPGEFTTMSGRRVRNAVEKHAKTAMTERVKNHPRFTRGIKFRSVIAGLSNGYSSYIATYEEYQLQRYEGASTIYGPFTQPAYVNQYSKLVSALIKGSKLPPGPTPPFYLDKLISFLPGVLYDSAPWGHDFGDVLIQPHPVYDLSTDVVQVRFVSACPRNNMRTNGTYLTVESFNAETHEWITQFTDSDWETRFKWGHNGALDFILGRSEADISWDVSSIDGVCKPGKYRIRHFGTHKSLLFSELTDFVGTTNEFQVNCRRPTCANDIQSNKNCEL